MSCISHLRTKPLADNSSDTSINGIFSLKNFGWDLQKYKFLKAFAVFHENKTIRKWLRPMHHVTP